MLCLTGGVNWALNLHKSHPFANLLYALSVLIERTFCYRVFRPLISSVSSHTRVIDHIVISLIISDSVTNRRNRYRVFLYNVYSGSGTDGVQTPVRCRREDAETAGQDCSDGTGKRWTATETRRVLELAC